MEVSVEEASTIDVPAEPVRVIIFFAVQVGVCPRCGRKVRATHPDLAAGQFGATAHRVGPNVQGQALALHYHSNYIKSSSASQFSGFTSMTMNKVKMLRSFAMINMDFLSWSISPSVLLRRCR
jgi:hypothetical protein